MKVKATLKQIAKNLTFLFLQFQKHLMIVLKLVIKQKLKKEYAKLKNYKPNVIGLNLKTEKTKQ
jgi:LacI family transcriptional regulator